MVALSGEFLQKPCLVVPRSHEDPWGSLEHPANHQGSFGEPTKYKAPSWPESWEEMNSWMNVIYVMYDPKAPAVFFFWGGRMDVTNHHAGADISWRWKGLAL